MLYIVINVFKWRAPCKTILLKGNQLTATYCDSLRLLAIIWNPGLSSASRTNSFSTVLGIRVGLAADRPFYHNQPQFYSVSRLFVLFFFLLQCFFSLIPWLTLSITHCGNSMTSCPILQ